ncbi:hypothetical protein NP233_g3763 [Leucocoprinus birnbaumii]|uniref:Glutathione S-transferase n=1 Tax=Leucocoprinus birnbaumii TaxID=56174 RepID=A0AAD5YW64_9AGAR|nr:hypothetical protein NP233_g3763 [Leucocoprinus birnbaumii]
MSAAPPVILYRYDASPYSHKIDNALLLKGISHSRVNVSPALPRPEITDLLGTTYRRIPILAIGYGTLLPRSKQGGSADTGLVKAFSKYYVDQLFSLGPLLLPWDKLGPDFIKDRSTFFGAPLDVKAIQAARPQTMSKLASHYALIEEQLSDDRQWLFDTESPSLADISVHFLLAWVNNFRGVESLYDEKQIPRTIKWLSRVSAFLENKKRNSQAPVLIKGEEAADKISKSNHEPLSIVGFNSTEAGRLGLKQGDKVKVAPEDTGRAFLTVGNLVALNREEVIVQVQGQKGVFHVHFPRLGFMIQPAVKGKL